MAMDGQGLELTMLAMAVGAHQCIATGPRSQSPRIQKDFLLPVLEIGKIPASPFKSDQHTPLRVRLAE